MVKFFQEVKKMTTTDISKLTTKESQKTPMLTGRNWTASLQPAWTEKQIRDFCIQQTGVATVWAITHDRDSNDEGERVEPHTHILIEYDTPRRLSSVANLLGVAPNFIEIARNQGTFRRYLCHLNHPEKYQYDPGDVITNSPVSYTDAISGKLLSNKDISEYIKAGRGQELLDVVSPAKLRQIQSFIKFDHDNEIRLKLEAMHESLMSIQHSLLGIHRMALEYKENLELTTTQLREGFGLLADSVNNAAKRVFITKHNAMRRK
jgi:hypothetical protein